MTLTAPLLAGSDQGPVVGGTCGPQLVDLEASEDLKKISCNNGFY